jgi:tubby-related protein 1
VRPASAQSAAAAPRGFLGPAAGTVGAAGDGGGATAAASSSSSSAGASSVLRRPDSAGEGETRAEMERRGIAPVFDGRRDSAPREIEWSDVRAGISQVCPQRYTMQCSIRREKGGMLGSTSYYLYGTDEKFLLAARKRKNAKGANYVITMSRTNFDPAGDQVVGKLRSNISGTTFTLYGAGVNPKKAGQNDTVREELASVFYKTNILGYKGPRQMKVVIPQILPSGVARVFRPEKPEEGLASRFDSDQLDDLIILNNRQPTWNEKTRAYVLNFNGRVTQASVKNFQLISPALDTEYVILQMGRTSASQFTCDYAYPLTCLQAFAIALSSFDNKALVE